MSAPALMTMCAELCPKRGMEQIRVGFEDPSLNTISQAEPSLRHSQEVLPVIIVGGFVC
jgi:hypothetical protein